MIVPSEPATHQRETVCVVIPTLNVGSIIDRCLRSVSWADEIIIVDMFSTDDTIERCRHYPQVRVYQRRDYIFSNVNFGMEQATTDWVIRLDSDEVLNEQLQESVLMVLRRPEPGINGYYFPSVQWMFGQPMHHGVGCPERNIRKCMFRKGTARYECRYEHEDITVAGNLGTLAGHYEHRTNSTVAEIVTKFNYYTDRDVERERGRKARPRIWRIVYRAARMFVLYYFQWRGYKDGHLGFFSSLFRGPVYVFIEEAKRWEAWSARSREYQEE